MAKIDFHPTQIDYLKNSEFLSKDLLQLLDKVESSTSRHVIVEIPEDKASDMRDAVSDHLVRVGFGPDYMPTSEGLMLESLVDTLFIP